MSPPAERPRQAVRPAAVLWDMDGTLVDTEPYWIEVEHEIVALHGDHWDMEKAHSLVGHDLRDSARIMQQRGGVNLDVDVIVNMLLDGVIERVRRRVPWRPGARELLADLNAAAIPCALVTMSWQRFALSVVNALPQGSFQAVISGDMVHNGKPHPEPYLTAAATLGVRPERCAAIEDSPTGVRAAVAAGCATWAVPNVVDIPPGDGYTVVGSLADIPRGALGLDRPRPGDHTRERATRPTPAAARPTRPAHPAPRRPATRRGRPAWVAYLVLTAVLAAGAAAAFVLRHTTPPPLKDIPVNAWAPYWELDAATASIATNGATLHQVSPFWFTAKGSTTIQYSANIVEADTTAFAAAARASGATVIPSVTDTTGKGIMATILADPVKRTKHVQTLTLLAGEYDGIDLDYEGFAYGDDIAARRPPGALRLLRLRRRLLVVGGHPPQLGGVHRGVGHRAARQRQAARRHRSARVRHRAHARQRQLGVRPEGDRQGGRHRAVHGLRLQHLLAGADRPDRVGAHHPESGQGAGR
jgi:HAD superfamily hydrolase (TIGR01509 family)